VPINRLIGLANILCALAGLPEIPTIENIDVSQGIDLDPLDVTIEVLEVVLDALPC
jgi:hypothetical protein